MDNMLSTIHEKFLSFYGEGGTLYAAAGRVNLIGEHTDYNGGYVFPGAIDKCIVAEIRPNGTKTVNLFAVDRNAATSFGLEEEDKAFGGTKPRRTFVGPRYTGGVSDHLPVVFIVYY